MHRLPQVCPPLNVQPKFRTVTKYARQDERRCRRHAASIIAQFVHKLVLDAHRIRKRTLRQAKWAHELFGESFANRPTIIDSPLLTQCTTLWYKL